MGKGFIITEKQVNNWIKKDRKNQEVLKLFSMGENLAQNPYGQPERWIIDFNDMSLEDASNYKLPFQYVKLNVKPERDYNRMKKRQINWWLFGSNADKMRIEIDQLSSYLAVPEVSKWAIFLPCPASWLPGNKTKVVTSEDFYVLGILTSNIHRTWMHAQKSTLKADIAYTHNTCFETFPFPQIVTKKLVTQIRQQMTKLHQYRMTQMQEKQWGITDLYNEFFDQTQSQLFQLHKKLDELVMLAYGFTADDNCLEKLWLLNQELANQEAAGENIIGPWSPSI